MLPANDASGMAMSSVAPGGMPVTDSRCTGATERFVVEGLVSAMSGTGGGTFLSDVSIMANDVGWIVAAAANMSGPVSVKVGYQTSPWLQAGATYPLTGSTSMGLQDIVPFVQITAPNKAICEVDKGNLTINKLVLASDGSTITEAEISWTGMSCTPDPYSPAGVQSPAKGPGCFHVF